jgi:hypothetical protein
VVVVLAVVMVVMVVFMVEEEVELAMVLHLRELQARVEQQLL